MYKDNIHVCLICSSQSEKRLDGEPVSYNASNSKKKCNKRCTSTSFGLINFIF